MQLDYQTRSYYGQRGSFLWMNRLDVGACTDTLLTYLHTVDELGFSTRRFYVKDIENDLKRSCTPDFDTASNTISQVMARLEYYLTKAYLQYVNGQQFGHTNPFALFNKLDVRKRGPINVSCRELFDLPMQRPTKSFRTNVLQKTRHGSVGIYLQAIQPHGKLYEDSKQQLSEAVGTIARRKVVCSLEHARWRLGDEPDRHEKYAFTNLPPTHPATRDYNKTLSIRIGADVLDTKTSLVVSKITRMDVNPQWVVPRSIIEKNVVPQAGSKDYSDAWRYFTRGQKTGGRMDVIQASTDILKSGNYFIIQEGGKDNAMRRIVFHSKNKFAIHLHDASSKGAFGREDRGVSHGCIRPEKLFDFAVLLLNDKDEETIERIRHSMEADIHSAYMDNDPSSDKKSSMETNKLGRARLIKPVQVKPTVPLFITYYALYLDEGDAVTEYPGVYGSDSMIYHQLLNYLPQMRMDRPCDEQNIADHLTGKEAQRQTFSRVVHRYNEPLYWKIRRIVLIHEDANDVLQNALLRAWNNLDNFQNKPKISIWIYYIAVNEALDLLRRKGNSRTVSADDDPSVVDILMTDDCFDGNKTQAQLQGAIAQLPGVQRAVLNLHYYKEMKYAETNELLDTSEGVLKTSYHLVIREIVTYLQDRD